MSGLFRRRVFLTEKRVKRHYDVVVVGGGVHGLATAYYLARRHGVTDVAVLERSYIGAGGSGRNTTVLRANYKTSEAIPFYRASFDLYRTLGQELDFNLLFSPRGQLTLAHSDGALRVQRERAETNRLLGIDSVFVGRDEVAELCPLLDLEGGGAHPILGALYHPPAAIVRHDAVVWAYAAAAGRLGVAIHQGVEATALALERERCVGVETPHGRIEAGTVVLAVGAWVSTLARTVGLRLPIVTHPLQAFVTEPVKPILDPMIASVDLLVYISQTDRGEFLVGAEIEPYSSYSTRSTFTFLSSSAARCIDLLPFMAKLPILRQWTGPCDMTPDFCPIMGATAVDGLVLDAGWGTWGFKAAPISGVTIAELVATGRTPALIKPFAMERFWEDRAVPERASSGTH